MVSKSHVVLVNIHLLLFHFREIVKILNRDTIIFDPKQDDSEFFFHGVKQSLRDINKKKSKEMEFLFDRVYGPSESNQDVYDGSTKDIIASLLEGYNCSGKTKAHIVKICKSLSHTPKH